MPEQFNPFGGTGGGLTGGDFGWTTNNIPVNFGTFPPPTPRGLTATEAMRLEQVMREQDRLLRPRRTREARPRQVPSLPVEERVIEFTIEKETTGRYYIVSAIVVNDKNKVIDQWTASTEEEADSMVAQMSEMFMRQGGGELPQIDLRYRDRVRQRGHLTRDDRTHLRRNDRDEVAEDSFSLDIDEDAIEEQSKRLPQEWIHYPATHDTNNVPF